MNTKITFELSAFKRLLQMRDFIVANRERFAAGTSAAKAVAGVISTITNLRKLSTEHASLENRLRELSRAKLEARAALREELAFIHHTARSIAVETPGFADKFRTPQVSDLKLLAAARAALHDAAPDAPAFVKHAMAPDFLEIVEAKIRKFEQAREEYASVKSALDVGRKALRESLRQALAGGYAIMRNTLRDDPIALEAWEAARRSPRAGRLRKTGVAPVTEPPQSQEPPPHAEPADVPPHVATGLP